jgi:hypothetical protein
MQQPKQQNSFPDFKWADFDPILRPTKKKRAVQLRGLFLSTSFNMEQDKQSKPRKRFVGRARNQERTAPDPNNIEDGAVEVASM